MKTTDSGSRLTAFPGRSPIKITRRFAVATLLVVAVAVVLGTPAPASAGAAKLYPPPDGPLPNASGQYQATWDKSGIYPPGPASYLNSVSVSKLAPNTSYYIPLYYTEWSVDEHGWPIFVGWVLGNWYFQTDARGAYKSGMSKGGGAIPYGVQVYDASTGTLVLAG